jgi:hypothetical protein
MLVYLMTKFVIPSTECIVDLLLWKIVSVVQDRKRFVILAC